MIFVDTSFWGAIFNERDQHHGQATAVARKFAGEQLVTTNFVRSESWTLVRRRMHHAAAVHFVTEIGNSKRTRLVYVTPEQEAEALRWLRRHDERVYSFVNATSFAVMKAMRIRKAFAFDDDFAAAGFVEVRP